MKLPKLVFIRDINKTIIKPHKYLAFTFIGYDISYSVNEHTKLVEKVKIQENVIVYLPKWKQFSNKPIRLQQRYFSFLKKALYHEYKYHVYFYEEKQLDTLYYTLKNIQKTNIRDIQTVIRNFQRKLITEQEKSHENAPKGKPFCYKISYSKPFKNLKI